MRTEEGLEDPGSSNPRWKNVFLVVKGTVCGKSMELAGYFKE